MRKINLWQRFAIYIGTFGNRYEDLRRGTIARNVGDDIIAGLVVAAFGIPLAMGFAMASGLRPEQGIFGGIVAGLLGAVFGGSKYLVYGPSAAFIPVIGGLMATYSHGFLVLASLIAGFLLFCCGFFRLGSLGKKIPRSIVIGFTVGVAIIIAGSQMGHALGFREKAGHGLINQFLFVFTNIGDFNLAAVTMTLVTILFCRASEKITSVIPGIVPALILGYFGSLTFWSNKGLVSIGDQYGKLSFDGFDFTPAVLPAHWDSQVGLDLAYYAVAFFFIAAIESNVYGRAADRLADNSGTPFNPNNELRSQGIIQMITPLFNSFPQTATMGRTALNIRSKGCSPLVGFSKVVFKVAFAIIFFRHLEKIPMACIAGILIYIAAGMVRKREIEEIIQMNNYHVTLMMYTLIAVPLLGFMIGVASALIIYAIMFLLFEKNKRKPKNWQSRKRMVDQDMA
jgi:MFS superfamily sulfate permease-like transporter